MVLSWKSIALVKTFNYYNKHIVQKRSSVRPDILRNLEKKKKYPFDNALWTIKILKETNLHESSGQSLILPKITNRSYNRSQTILTDLHLTKVVCSDLLSVFLDAKNVCAWFNSILEITNLMLSRFAKVNIFYSTTETVLKRSYKPYGDVSIIS